MTDLDKILDAAVASAAEEGRESTEPMWDIVARHAAHAALDALRDELKPRCERSYCDGLDQFMRKECLGWEAKVESGEFGKAEMDAHELGNLLIGQHQGYVRALKAIQALKGDDK